MQIFFPNLVNEERDLHDASKKKIDIKNLLEKKFFFFSLISDSQMLKNLRFVRVQAKPVRLKKFFFIKETNNFKLIIIFFLDFSFTKSFIQHCFITLGKIIYLIT